MKLSGLFIIATLALVSCSKNVNSPAEEQSHLVFYQAQNVKVENFTAVETTPGNIQVSFTTTYENGIQQIEIMSTASTDHFCTTKIFTVSGNSFGNKQYVYNDNLIKGATMYYMLRFKDANGNWEYSDYYTIQNVQ